MQGISPIQPLFAKIGLENICEPSNFETNSLRGEQGIILPLQGINSGFWTGAGNSVQTDPLAPTHSDRVLRR
jgi:hypothetical protein